MPFRVGTLRKRDDFCRIRFFSDDTRKLLVKVTDVAARSLESNRKIRLHCLGRGGPGWQYERQEGEQRDERRREERSNILHAPASGRHCSGRWATHESREPAHGADVCSTTGTDVCASTAASAEG